MSCCIRNSGGIERKGHSIKVAHPALILIDTIRNEVVREQDHERQDGH